MDNDTIIRSRIISKINEKDREVLNHLGNISELSTAALGAINDKMPNDPVTPTKVGTIKLKMQGMQSNYVQELKSTFNSIPVDENAVIGKFDISGHIFECDIFIRRVTVAMLITGYSSDKDLAEAVENLFLKTIRIVTTSKGLTTTKEYLKALEPDKGNKYQENLIKAITELAKE